MMKRKNRVYPKEFKEEAVTLVRSQGYSVSEAAASLGISAKLLSNWKVQYEQSQLNQGVTEDEKLEIKRLRRQVKILQQEKEILKKASAFFAKELS